MSDTQTLRSLFIAYFEKHHHKFQPSSSLIPEGDESLLFVNAGMVPFKTIFSGHAKAEYPCVVSIQRCLRAGGKHNDLDNVGYTARHHTFFEMLGHFSFGAYFKTKAIRLAWDFLTCVLKLPPEKLWITVFEEDEETEKIWLHEIKIHPSRLSRCGTQDNFWSMGDTGPCGPCTEIFYDYGPTVQGGPPGSEEAEGDRYVEIWNLVFMQYERTAEQMLIPLKTQGVDTGMGLERLASVMQGVTSNYETDLFKPLIQAVTHLMPMGKKTPLQSRQVIADHIRAITFLILDGIVPGNEGRAYVLRRIIRRALRHGYQAGLKQPFLHQLIPVFIAQMQLAYPILQSAESHIIKTVLAEEQQFLKTLQQGLLYFEKVMATLKETVLPGSFVFKLYDTYGFPADLTADLAKEHGLLWDQAGFESEMALQKKRSKQASAFKEVIMPEMRLTTDFVGYKDLQSQSRIIGLLNQENQAVDQLSTGERGCIILDKTPFYAEAGGQIADQGSLIEAKNLFEVVDTQKKGTLHQHMGLVKVGTFKFNQHLQATVDRKRRKAIAQHHTATHLLHAALRQKLSIDITQKGSLVTADYLRFDFNYASPITPDCIKQIESQINQIIWDNLKAHTELMSLEAAQKVGAIALFNEKYQQSVRVLKVGNFSTELCGGTHVAYTGELGLFKITDIHTIASGIKRIEALAGEAAFNWLKQIEQQQIEMATVLKTDTQHLMPRLTRQLEKAKQQTTEIVQLQQYALQSLKQALIKRIMVVKNLNLLVAEIPDLLAKQARSLIDQIKSETSHPSIIILGCMIADTIEISIGISKNYTVHVTSKEIINLLVPIIKGKGGGRPDFAHLKSLGGDKNCLQQALQSVEPWLRQYLDVRN